MRRKAHDGADPARDGRGAAARADAPVGVEPAACAALSLHALCTAVHRALTRALLAFAALLGLLALLAVVPLLAMVAMLVVLALVALVALVALLALVAFFEGLLDLFVGTCAPWTLVLFRKSGRAGEEARHDVR